MEPGFHLQVAVSRHLSAFRFLGKPSSDACRAYCARALLVLWMTRNGRRSGRRGATMIEFSPVTHEFRSLVERRRELSTFLGSAFAALGLFLHNSLQGGLPDSLKAIQQHLFADYAFALMVISLILALRMAKLHGGMVLNGILY